MNYEKDLFTYRLRQAEETLADAEAMLRNGLSPRSITNRVKAGAVAFVVGRNSGL